MVIGLGTARAQDEPEPSNLSATSLGAQVVWVPTLGAVDLDALVGQRLRWGFGDVADGYNRAWVNARFTLDPLREVLWERTRVTHLGVEARRGAVTVDLGRAPVRYGGPRLVDGIQGVVDVGDGELGLWAGLAPDLFTTLPRLRPAAGPVVAWSRPQAQASVVGEVALSPDLALDRVASLAMARVTRDRWLDLSGRLDVDWVSPDGGPHLADGQALAVVRPGRSWQLEALYNAFSSLRYLQTEPLDPSVQRFQQRLLDLGVQFGVQQDFLDPTVNHLVGGGVRFAEPAGLGAAFHAGVDGRYRWHPNPLNRFARVHGQAGVGEIPVGGALDLSVDGSAYHVNGALQGDGGVIVVWEPTEDRSWAIDTSHRALLAPDVYPGFGWYSDLFVDAAIGRRWFASTGVNATREPDPDFDDLGVVAYARVTAFLR